MKIQGAITALVTPFIDDTIDEKGFIYNIHYQIDNGINGLLVLGSTGEDPTLSIEEQEKLIAITVREVRGRIPVIAGTGSWSTRETIVKTKRARALGVDGVLIMTPYYNKPMQEGIYRHFEAITAAVQIPIIIYNNQGRCGTNISVSTLLRIAHLPHIVGIKEASGNISQAAEFLHTVCSKYPNFKVFSGDDALTLSMMSHGGHGIISVISNLVPREVVALTTAALQKNFEAARVIDNQLLPLYKAAFIESNPIPIKKAMMLCGMPAGECRLPLCDMSEENLNILIQTLEQLTYTKNILIKEEIC